MAISVKNHVTHLLNKVDTGLEIHTEVNELPVNSFLLVFFLLQHEHVVIEELLKSLIGIVDADLLESIVLQNKSHHKSSMEYYTKVFVIMAMVNNSHYIYMATNCLGILCFALIKNVLEVKQKSGSLVNVIHGQRQDAKF